MTLVETWQKHLAERPYLDWLEFVDTNYNPNGELRKLSEIRNGPAYTGLVKRLDQNV